MESEVHCGSRRSRPGQQCLFLLILTGCHLSCQAVLQVSQPGNLWVTWANKTGQTDFCLSLQSATEPFRTCLIGVPGYRLESFQGYVRDNPCFHYNTSEQSACLIERLSVSLPWDPQELDLLGSQAIGNASVGWNQTCFCFGRSHQGLSAQANILKQLWDYADNPFFDATGWTVVSPHNEQAFSAWGAYCGYSNQTGEGGNLRPWYGYGASLSEDDSQPALWNNDSAKALPPGVFLICGDRAWAGVPANVQGGPCYLGQLALFAPQHRQWLNVASGLRKARRWWSTRRLTPDCNDNVDLWSATARVFTSFLTPGVAAAQALKQLENLACWSAKQANETTLILGSMLSDMNSLRHALLQNRAAIDFLLLAQGHGCEDFEGMCCFNLSDHSRSIHKQLQWLKEHTQKIQVNKNPFDEWLESLFGGLPSWLAALIKEGLRWLLLILVMLLLLCIVYSCVMRGIDKATQKAMLVQKEKGGIVGGWLREQGGHETVYEHSWCGSTECIPMRKY